MGKEKKGEKTHSEQRDLRITFDESVSLPSSEKKSNVMINAETIVMIPPVVVLRKNSAASSFCLGNKSTLLNTSTHILTNFKICKFLMQCHDRCTRMKC
jgi:spore maturation protein SpmA